MVKIKYKFKRGSALQNFESETLEEPKRFNVQRVNIFSAKGEDLLNRG